MRSWICCLATSALLAACTSVAGQQGGAPAAPEVAPETDGDPAADPREAQRGAEDGPVDAAELLAAFSRLEGIEARFEESKHMALLAVPLTSKGRLFYRAPGRLLRVVEAPEPSRLLIAPDQLRMTNRDGTEVIDLRQSDALRLFVSSLVSVFSGDAQALDESYTLTFTKHAQDHGESAAGKDGAAATGAPGRPAWTLTLTPKGKPLSDMLASLSLSGSAYTVSSIEVNEPNGDRSVTTLHDVDTARVFTDEERLELFDLPPRR